MKDLKLTKKEKNSINLIEKRVNSTGVIYKEDIGDMKKEIEHSSSKSIMEDLYKICKNHGIYMGNRNGEIIFISSFFLLDYANKKLLCIPKDHTNHKTLKKDEGTLSLIFFHFILFFIFTITPTLSS